MKQGSGGKRVGNFGGGSQTSEVTTGHEFGDHGKAMSYFYANNCLVLAFQTRLRG